MKDFSPQIHQSLLQHLIQAEYTFQTFLDFIEELKTTGRNSLAVRNQKKKLISDFESTPPHSVVEIGHKLTPTRCPELFERDNHQPITESYQQKMPQTSDIQHRSSSTRHQTIILRHDVEQRYQNALKLAQIQSELGVKGAYYFRILPKSYDSGIVKEIAQMGHEIGYHYDDLAICRGDLKKAFERFQRNLETLRKIAPVKTMTMDGSPLSKYDNRDLWKKYNYKDLGIIAEPYFDLDFNDIFYITDTGRRWDGHLFNVRDKATKENPVTNEEFLKLRFHSTFDMIDAIKQRQSLNLEQGTLNLEHRTSNKEHGTSNIKHRTSNIEHQTSNKGHRNHTTTQARNYAEQIFPTRAMLNFHPQRWNSNPYLWTKELVLQNVKNQVKRFLVKRSR